jgi:hypothetical protein
MGSSASHAMYFNLNRWLKTLNLRLEKLPPFWAVYAFILVETVGEGVLAIPIAVAKIGPLAGIVFIFSGKASRRLSWSY